MKAEIIYVICIFASPALFSWLPFCFNAYGYSGAWCWIRELEDDCTKFTLSIFLQFSMLYIPVFIMYPLLVFLLIISLWYFYRQRYNYDAQLDLQATQRRTKMRREIRSLFWYPCIVLGLNVVPLVTRIYVSVATDKSYNVGYILWGIDSFFTGIKGGVIALTYLMQPETRKRLKWMYIKAACRGLCNHKGRIMEYPVREEVIGDSVGSDNTRHLINDEHYNDEDDVELTASYHEIDN
jgi:hypothetical protein